MNDENQNETERARGDELAETLDRFTYGALALTVLGAVGPWVRAPFLGSVAGLDGDGVLYVIAAALLAFAIWREWSAALCGALSILAGLFVGGNSVRLVVDLNANPIAQVGWGLYASILAGLILVAGGIGYAVAWLQDDEA